MKNILVTGANGMLGQSIKFYEQEFSEFRFYFTDKNKVDITQIKDIEQFVTKNKIDIIINCAAYTNVDKAEDEIELANEINFKAVANLAKVSKKYKVKLVHISTDYVFDGNSEIAYLENDKVLPQNIYGKSKLKGEDVLKEINPENSIIIRTAWLFSEFGKNFVKTILKLSLEKETISVVTDQIGSPTYAKDLAKTILHILPKLHNKNVDTYHYANSGKCSWFGFASKIVEFQSNKCIINPVDSTHNPVKATRPKFSLLNTSKIKNTFNIEIPSWKNALKICLTNL